MDKPVMPAAIHYPTQGRIDMGQYKHEEFSPVNSSSHCGFSAHSRETNISNSLTPKDWLLITLSAIAFVGTSWIAIVAISMLGS